MGTAERRLEILKYLCQKRHTTMHELAEIFGVSVRTISRDIYEIEATFHAPLDVRCGKYNGGIYVVGDYTFDRAYMNEEELQLLNKISIIVEGMLLGKENKMLLNIIKKYSKRN